MLTDLNIGPRWHIWLGDILDYDWRDVRQMEYFITWQNFPTSDFQRQYSSLIASSLCLVTNHGVGVHVVGSRPLRTHCLPCAEEEFSYAISSHHTNSLFHTMSLHKQSFIPRSHFALPHITVCRSFVRWENFTLQLCTKINAHLTQSVRTNLFSIINSHVCENLHNLAHTHILSAHNFWFLNTTRDLFRSEQAFLGPSSN